MTNGSRTKLYHAPMQLRASNASAIKTCFFSPPLIPHTKCRPQESSSFQEVSWPFFIVQNTESIHLFIEHALLIRTCPLNLGLPMQTILLHNLSLKLKEDALTKELLSRDANPAAAELISG